MAKGYQVITEDGVLHASGKAVTVYGINIVSGATATVITLRNGVAVGDTAVIVLTGTVSSGTYVDFGAGMTFPSGCYVDVDANTTSVTLVYEVA